MSGDIKLGIKLTYDGKELAVGVGDVRKKLDEITQAVDKVGLSSKATAAAMRNVPAQFTDIVTALQGGQAPLTVLLQQGGQLKDMFGGIGPAAKALGSYLGGLVNPLTLTAAAVGALGVAYMSGAKEQETFARTLIMSGNVSATTAGQLQAMAAQVAASTGATRGLAAETLNELVASGKVSVDMLAKVSQAALDLERVGGPAVSDTAKQFAALGDDPVKASLKLNEQTHYLTAAVYEQIKALAEQGRTSEAAALAQSTYANAIEQRIPALAENLGTLERAWRTVANGANIAWDSMLNVGRSESLEDKLAAVDKAIANAKKPNRIDDGEVGLATLEKQRAVLLKLVDDQGRVNFRIAAGNVEREAGLALQIKTDTLREKYQTREQLRDKEILAINASNLSVDEKRTALALVAEKYAEKKQAAAKGLSVYDAALIARSEEALRVAKELDAELDEINKGHQDYAKAVEALLGPLEKEADSLERQAQNYGLTRAEIDATAASRLEEALAIAALHGAYGDSLAFLQRELELRRRIAAASAEIAAQDAAAAGAKSLKDAAKEAQTAWEKTTDKIGDSLSESLMRGFEKGQSAAQTLRDTVVNMFKTMVLQPVIKAGFVGGLSALGMGSANAAEGSSSGVGGLGNLFSAGSSAYSMYSGTSGLYGAFATSEIGAALGLSSQVAAGTAASAYSAGGSIIAGELSPALTSLGSTIGAAIPYIGLATAAISLLAGSLGKGGTPHVGGIVFANAAGTDNTHSVDGIVANFQTPTDANNLLETDWTKRYSQSTADSLAPTATAISTILNTASKQFGQDIQYQVGLAYSADGEDKSRGRLTIVNDSTNELLETTRGRYSKDAATGLGEFIASTGTAVRQVLDEIDMPAWADKMLAAVGDTPSIDQLSAVVTQINAIAAAAEVLAPAFKMTEDSFAELYTTLGANTLNAYYEGYYSAAERTQNLQEQLTQAFADLNLELPDSRAGFRALVESLDVTTEAGKATYASVMSLQGSFGQMADAAKAAADQVISAANASGAARKADVEARRASETALADAAKSGAAEAKALAEDLFSGIQAGIKSIDDWLKSSVLGDASVLSPVQKIDAAQAQFDALYAKAQGGDTEALQALPAAASALEQVARDGLASSPAFVAIDANIRQMLAALGDGHQLTPEAQAAAAHAADIAFQDANYQTMLGDYRYQALAQWADSALAAGYDADKIRMIKSNAFWQGNVDGGGGNQVDWSGALTSQSAFDALNTQVFMDNIFTPKAVARMSGSDLTSTVASVANKETAAAIIKALERSGQAQTSGLVQVIEQLRRLNSSTETLLANDRLGVPA